LIVIVSFVLAFVPNNEDDLFDDFIAKYNKKYETAEEYEFRFQVFRQNLLIAAKLDALDDDASFGVTKFMDLSPEEFKKMYLIRDYARGRETRRQKLAALDPSRTMKYVAPSQPIDYPTTYDWNDYGVITPVYDQGTCGSCWDFSATENMESMWAIAGHNLTSLSMQQVLDCDRLSLHCDGGDPPSAYLYAMEVGGLESFASYPYTGRRDRCAFNKSKIVADVSHWKLITIDNDEKAMQSFTYQQGPPSVCVDAASWQYYTGGVITSKSGCGVLLDHCVAITGWSIQSNMSVWNVRNSWGTSWGPYDGYLYIEMGKNVCGIGLDVTSSFGK